ARLDHVEGLSDHRALDAAARDRALEIALAVDHQMTADRAWRRTPGLDHGCERHLAALLAPGLGERQHILLRRLDRPHRAVSFAHPDPLRRLAALVIRRRARPPAHVSCSGADRNRKRGAARRAPRSEEHTSEL